VRKDVLSKRAGTSLMLGCFDAAKADALESISGAPTDWKAYLTAGRASYGLWSYADANDHFLQALRLNPNANAVKKEHARCVARLQEEKSGSYDFRSLFATLSPQHVHMDAASYFANTIIQDSPHHGRGIFAARNIAAGELVFCEKAGQMPNQYEPTRASAALFAKMTHQLFDNPSLAPKVLALHGGDYVRSGLEGTIVDGVPVVDVFLLESIRTKNCFSSPLSTLEETKPDSPPGRLAKGLWTYASHMNHACTANTHRSFLGDLLISRATRPIRKGEELFQNYIPVQPLREGRQAAFAEWGFQCHCELCDGEDRSPAEKQAKRLDVLRQIEKLAAKRPPGRHEPDAVIKSMERLYRQLEDLHEEAVFAKLPRVMLIFPTMWLLAANGVRKRYAKVVEYARAALRNFGWLYGAEEQADVRSMWEKCVTSPALMSIHIVTALRDGAEASTALGQSEKAKQWREASRFGYRIITGFEDDVGQLEAKSKPQEVTVEANGKTEAAS
jgi:tetratricopeptide (TPR) repeat protein